MDLKELRERLTAIDRRIVELAAERQAVVEQIGQVKRDAGQATRDFAREKQVIETAREQAIGLGVPPRLAEALMRLLIESSLTKQERARVQAEGRGQGQQALVIGGAGKMGRWFADFLDSQGYRVTIADPETAGTGYAAVSDWRDTPDEFQLTVVSTPIALTARVLDELGEQGRSGLIFDIGSLKTPLMPALRRLAERGAEVTSVHPMFGPDTELLSGRHVLFLEAGNPAATRAARALFESTMAEQIEMPLDDHDRLIAYVLGLSHALNIAFFSALADSGESLPRLSELSSTTFDAQLGVAARVAQENPDLYFEIQAQNPFGEEALRVLRDAVERVGATVAAGDRDAFVELMERGRAYLEKRA
jgi:chorismate mutase/prephenate dehydrogenase